ncbi:glycine--tRNA ligase subunit beta [Salmonella enterica subsp. enterica]|nr:glycine--tRNA ligase subunit beta [Salmonella enterica subsp. enterica]
MKTKDRPFALRRAALGVLRIIVEKNLNLDLQTLTEEAKARLYGDKLTNANVVDDVIDFMLGRFRAGIRMKVHTVDTIRRYWRVVRPVRRVRCPHESGVAISRTTEEASALAAANWRVSSIWQPLRPLNIIVHASVLKKRRKWSWPDIWLCCVISFSRTFADGRYQEKLVYQLAALRAGG